MTWQYTYTPFVWPMLGSALFMSLLAAYGWFRRTIPGAVPFALLMSLAALWSFASALQLLASTPQDKIFWAKLEATCGIPVALTSLWFAVEYGNLARWFTRKVFACLAIPALVSVPLVLTSARHDLLWREFLVEDSVQQVFAPLGLMLMTYGFLVALATPVVFLWLFLRSPLHRWPAGLCIAGNVVARIAFVVENTGKNPIEPVDMAILSASFTGSMYALALFRFHMFDLIPVARGTVIEQMREGMLVLDAHNRIVDLNPAASRILGITAAHARGKEASTLLPLCPAMTASAPGTTLSDPQFTGTMGPDKRHYALHISPLRSGEHFPLGHLLLLYDVTEQRHTQARRLDQQRALAALEERDRVARELHDDLGQVLGFVKMQAQAARGLLAKSDASAADQCLAQLVAVAQDAHADVREYILAARCAMPSGSSFPAVVEEYVRRFVDAHGICIKIQVDARLTDGALEPMAAAQLLRIIQETLTNVRKHAQARTVGMTLAIKDGCVEVHIADDGTGFDPERSDGGQSFGLQFMRERAKEVAGSIDIDSVPGLGTRVTIRVPLRRETSS